MAKKTNKLIDALTEIVLWTTDIKDREFSVLERLYNKDDKVIVNAFDLCEHSADLTISDIFTAYIHNVLENMELQICDHIKENYESQSFDDASDLVDLIFDNLFGVSITDNYGEAEIDDIPYSGEYLLDFEKFAESLITIINDKDETSSAYDDMYDEIIGFISRVLNDK